jgi:hypothetical protein
VTTTTLSIPVPVRADSAPSRRVGSALLIALFVAITLAGRLCYLAKPFDHDARLFIYLGKLFTDGGRFGHDVIDNKFPTVGMMTSVWWRLLGLSWPGYVLTQTAMVIAGALLLGRIARRNFDASSSLPTALFALVFLDFSIAVFGGFQLETMQTLFAIFAAGAALEALRSRDWRDAFFVGLAAGCAMMFKPTGGAVLGAFGIASMVRLSRNPRTLLEQGGASVIGLAIPLAVTLVYLVRSDTLRDIPDLYRQIACYAADTPMTLADWCKPLVVLALLGFPLVVRARILRHDRITPTLGPDQSALLFVMIWFILELAGVIAQRRMCAYHFLTIAPPAALLYGMIPRRPRLVSALAGLLPIMLLSSLGAVDVVRKYYPSPARLAASDYLIAHTRTGDSVWQDSFGRLLLETNLRPGSRVPLSYLFFNNDDAPQHYAGIMLKDFEHRRPRYILLPQDLDAWVDQQDRSVAQEPGYERRRTNYRLAWKSIFNYVTSHYAAETNIDGQTLYRRRDSTPISN